MAGDRPSSDLSIARSAFSPRTSPLCLLPSINCQLSTVNCQLSTSVTSITNLKDPSH
ncbi:MAG: hypothetical protein JGK01_17050 [Microcoleus sp. PH2017_03_ELD_O_A]|uniref:hypothetical protein n=1 Tax=unclassified Microcoleus TaxID=2642155 RepID=UPI001E0169E1|nr:MULTISPECIES: hypothetical protein [unclassified Microcoleus]MCC3443442.1 hypothetical protein [Microcoleus sp. PH2017_03_ELD_O_A]MCC3450616.1 hypothetical protein [Microcoleus sp. PH2017_09_SFU_O_A]MCC3556059.1 hypothetical protein [Microcoleus sp. PH2017_35_SFW_U_B]MCC3622694.1 hypothetical protein [Microcoleus sp. PH2017_36_ELK_O_B]